MAEENDEEELEIVEEEESNEASGDSSMENYELDALLATQTQQLMGEFQVELVDNVISRIKVYLDISLTEHYVIGIDFSAYPQEKPLLTVQEAVKEAIGDPNLILNTLKDWNQGNPPSIVEIVRELETILYEDSMYKAQADQISHEFKIEPAGDSRNHYIITFITYGWREYKVDIYLSSQFNPPKLVFSNNLESIIGSADTIEKLKNWNSEIQINEILRDIQWKIDNHERMNFEIDLLHGGLENVSYDSIERTVKADLKGVMNTSDRIFSFTVDIPTDYPMAKPVFKLETEIQEDKLASAMSETTEAALVMWEPFNFLIDVFNAISKSIFSASVLSCIVCHNVNCPVCGKSLSTQDGTESCFFKCPYCGKPYHLHCWEQNIRAINKCAFCLRTPPATTISSASSEPDQSADNSNDDIESSTENDQ
jgi:hypothetical protein